MPLLADAQSTDLWSKFVAFIREFGLPSFLVLWFLFRIEKKLERFTTTLSKLVSVVVVMLKTMEKDDEADSLLNADDKEKGLLESAKEELAERHQKKASGEGD